MPRPIPAGRTRRCRPSASATTCATSATLLDEFGYDAALYGHFGQGCIHCRIDFDLDTADGIRQYRRSSTRPPTWSSRYGGSLSGEHGDGQARAELLPKMYGDELVEAFREFKAIWDPDGKMNPGKVVDPIRPTTNLRLGPDYRAADADDPLRLRRRRRQLRRTPRCAASASASAATSTSGTMCPSYMVTREEKHTTRGRARLLFEMLRGDELDGWRRRRTSSESLDLCLACKGCKSDCPVNVDMATYKAEFLSHHYERRLRPRAAYAMGLIYCWARAATHVPRVGQRADPRPRALDAHQDGPAASPSSARAPLRHDDLHRLVPGPDPAPATACPSPP